MQTCPFSAVKAMPKDEAPAEAVEEKKKGGCPFTGGAKGVDIDAVDENPSVNEYKKIKRVMGIITQFYRDGTNLKKGHYDEVTQEIAKLDSDLSMVKEQTAALTENPAFDTHPKQKEYLNQLNMEKEHLDGQRVKFVEKQQEYKGIYEWSEGIVRVCEWLELNLDDYCSKTLDYPKLKDVKPAPELTKEEAAKFSEGLDEIYHNLEDSQDFFSASLDGRLDKFHALEKQIVESQLAVVRKYPEDCERRKHIEQELLADLAFVEENINGDSADTRRREKMLNSHSDFFKVLKFHKEKLRVLYFDNSNKVYDPRFDVFQK